MTYTPHQARLAFDQENNQYSCEGDWSILNISEVLKKLEQTSLPFSKKLTISGKKIKKLDSSGALMLSRCSNRLKERKNQVELIDFSEQQRNLLHLIDEKKEEIDFNPTQAKEKNLLYLIGKETVAKLHQAQGLIVLIGDLSEKLLAAFGNWRRFQFPSIIANINGTGVTALPILALLAFLIGVVLAYQMGLQLETYGASIFIAYLSGMAIFREFAPLITAIIVAGRTSSAFTAQIGSMKINEEIDALYTMGLSPTELLVVPKVIALLFVFPLLIFWADFFSILGAMFMSKFMLNVGYHDFLTRLHDSVGFKQMMLGLDKAPAFAILIALVGCFQGFRVESSAASLGSQTTRSVVQALFLIIIADATYSVIYSWLDL